MKGFIAECVVVLLNAFVLFSCTKNDCPTAPKAEYSPAEQAMAAQELVKRITGSHFGRFEIVVDPVLKDGCDWFAYYASGDGQIVLEGNEGVSVASALHAYLKQYCGWHSSWCGNNHGLPESLPLPLERVEKKSPYKYRYNLNYCTFNYSLSWWDEDRKSVV